ncbi:MAG: OmpA family protein [Bacteroidetes bacterium]|nr:OmpA family protein [Rhodothermia bacterium]MCS7154368.1 OmpA family protein [Bacteroidota bacterium]MCX7907613.1 OmpA family protein [Bacteroidota bacterium]MDW8137743.1 OmpA family protein [Bacteroidota bacterium]MDW8286407.1 OmpA family protein [Bacteroidota bacterium]
MRALSVFALLFTLVSITHGQTERKLWVGLNVGLPSYVGDYNRIGTAVGGNAFQLVTGRWMASAQLGYELSRTLGLRFALGYGEAHYEPSGGNFPRGATVPFHTTILPIEGQLLYSFAPAATVNPYAFLGLGALYYQPFDNRDNKLRDGSVTLLVPIGAGLEFALSRRLSLLLEVGYRHTQSDYLENYSAGSKDVFGTKILTGDALLTYSAGLRLNIGSAPPPPPPPPSPVVNNPPVWRSLPDQTGMVGERMVVAVQASDPDGDPLTLRALSLPQGAQFRDLGNGAGQITWTPTEAQVGAHTAELEASDGKARTSGRLRLTVQARPAPPPALTELNTVFFDFDKADIDAEAARLLDENVRLLQQNPQYMVRIDAYTDYVGTAQYNLRLSQRRAEAVRRYYESRGIDPARITARGLGFYPQRCGPAEQDPGPGCRWMRRAISVPLPPSTP